MVAQTASVAARIAEQLADPRSTAGVLNTLGFALLGTRAVTDAHISFRTAFQLSRERGYQYHEVQAGIGTAAAILATGETEQARTAARDALRIAERKEYRILAGDALATLAQVALVAGDPISAADHCRVARAHYRSAGSPGRLRKLHRIEQESLDRTRQPAP